MTSTDVWNFEVGMKQKIETESEIFAGIVDANIEMQLLFSENQTEMNHYIRETFYFPLKIRVLLMCIK